MTLFLTHQGVIIKGFTVLQTFYLFIYFFLVLQTFYLIILFLFQILQTFHLIILFLFQVLQTFYLIILFLFQVLPQPFQGRVSPGNHRPDARQPGDGGPERAEYVAATGHGRGRLGSGGEGGELETPDRRVQEDADHRAGGLSRSLGTHRRRSHVSIQGIGYFIHPHL